MKFRDGQVDAVTEVQTATRAGQYTNGVKSLETKTAKSIVSVKGDRSSNTTNRFARRKQEKRLTWRTEEGRWIIVSLITWSIARCLLSPCAELLCLSLLGLARSRGISFSGRLFFLGILPAIYFYSVHCHCRESETIWR